VGTSSISGLATTGLEKFVSACSVQWQSFLRLLGDEWRADQSREVLRAQMRERGVRWACAQALPAVTDLKALEQAMNDCWSQLQGGWVRLIERPDALVLVHGASPLAATFGPEAVDWSVGWLEGIYQAWLEAAGASPASRVSGVPDPTDPTRFELRLSSVVAEALPAAYAPSASPGAHVNLEELPHGLA
jgi:hypothetical protein